LISLFLQATTLRSTSIKPITHIAPIRTVITAQSLRRKIMCRWGSKQE